MTESPPSPAEPALAQTEQAAIEALAHLLHVWYEEAGLHGMLRSLDAAMSQCHALLDEFATEAGREDAEPETTAQRAARHAAERGALSQHLLFMRELCGGM